MPSVMKAEDFSTFLAELGYSLPSVALNAITSRVNDIASCMDAAGYDDTTAGMIQLYAAALMAISTGARRLASQGAPSGASRSFQYNDDGVRWLRDSLEQMDTHGCTLGLPIAAGDSVGYFRVVGA